MKDTFDKVVMDEERKEEMRKMLSVRKTGKTKRRTWIPVLAGIAALATVLVVVPFTRNMIVAAAEALGFKKTKSGVEVSATSIVDPESKFYIFEKSVKTPKKTEESKYAQVKDGRLYFVNDGNWVDVTDQCSETAYYRYETKDQDGDKVVIYVGGTPDAKGSLEFTYGPDGKVYVAYGDVDVYAASWIESAFAKEGLSFNTESDGYLTVKDDESVGGSILIVRIVDGVPEDDLFADDTSDGPAST